MLLSQVSSHLSSQSYLHCLVHSSAMSSIAFSCTSQPNGKLGKYKQNTSGYMLAPQIIIQLTKYLVHAYDHYLIEVNGVGVLSSPSHCTEGKLNLRAHSGTWKTSAGRVQPFVTLGLNRLSVESTMGSHRWAKLVATGLEMGIAKV